MTPLNEMKTREIIFSTCLLSTMIFCPSETGATRRRDRCPFFTFSVGKHATNDQKQRGKEENKGGEIKV